MKVSKLLLAIILLTTTCGLLAAQTPAPARAESSGGENGLASTQWRLTSFGLPGAEAPVVEGAEVTLEFGPDGRAGGSSGCNSYGGDYRVQNDRVTFGQIVSTKRACADERANQQERQYFQALGAVGRFELTDKRLVIFYDGERGALNFVKTSAPKSAAAGQQSADSQTAQRDARFAEAADFISFEGTHLKGRAASSVAEEVSASVIGRVDD